MVDDDRGGVISTLSVVQLGGDPPTDRIVSTREVPGVVGVEALDTLTGATDTAGRAVHGVGGTSASRSAA